LKEEHTCTWFEWLYKQGKIVKDYVHNRLGFQNWAISHINGVPALKGFSLKENVWAFHSDKNMAIIRR